MNFAGFQGLEADIPENRAMEVFPVADIRERSFGIFLPGMKIIECSFLADS
jgi:hypothetical protein